MTVITIVKILNVTTAITVTAQPNSFSPKLSKPQTANTSPQRKAENRFKTTPCNSAKGSDYRVYGGFPKIRVPFGGPYNKDYSILGSILGSPYCGKLTYSRAI